MFRTQDSDLLGVAVELEATLECFKKHVTTKDSVTSGMRECAWVHSALGDTGSGQP